MGLKSSKRTCKQVAQFTVPGELINTWESLTVASTQLNIPRSTLSMLIKSQKVKDNVIFKYI